MSNELAGLLALATLGCAAVSPRMPLLTVEPPGCERLGIVWQSAPFPLWNDWKKGLEWQAAELGADTLVLRRRYFGFAMAEAWRCAGG